MRLKIDALVNLLNELVANEWPPCVAERVSFMAPFEITRSMSHPYSNTNPETHGHFTPTKFIQPSYSAACVPYRWMLRSEIEGSSNNNQPGLAERLQIGWVADREPTLNFNNAWIQERGQSARLPRHVLWSFAT